jgi:[NiFe] hydrogenase large subunit
MGERVVVDPVTRIEGHLRIEVEVENGKVKDAWSSGTLFRGIEIILSGRDPRDAWVITQRICGVCPTPHGTASAMSMDDSFGIKKDIPDGGRIMRNLMLGANYLHSHILHFYHLTALDYVDVVNALKADPKKATELAQAVGTKVSDFAAVKGKLKAFIDSGQLGPFANGYWGHPAYQLPPEVNLIAVAHYLEALEMQAKASKAQAVFEGRAPIGLAITAGGVSSVPTVDTLVDFKHKILEIKDWIESAYLPDILAVAPYYLDAASYGGGYGNFIAWGVFPYDNEDPLNQCLPRGVIFDGDIAGVQDVSPEDATEYVKHSWYTDDCSNLNPSKGKTKPAYKKRDLNDKYSWLKAPRIKDKPCEGGPLARMAVAYGRGDKAAKKLIDGTLEKLNLAGKTEILVSTLGRVAARALECKKIADAMPGWIDEMIELVKKGKAKTFKPYKIPDKGEGIGLTEAPRGALGHWNTIEGGKIKNYQAVPATIWNCCPRDDKGQRGPVEQALIGTPVADPKRPLEIIRVVHSFDP